MRVLITGHRGLVGSALVRRLAREPSVEIGGISRHLGDQPSAAHREWALDLADREAAAEAFRDFPPDLVIHTASMTAVDACEREPETAWREIVEVTRTVAENVARVGGRLLHLSSDYVFDGEDGPYAEDASTRPLNVYGRAKLASEAVVRELTPGATIARLSVIFGYAPHRRPDFVSLLLERLAAGQSWDVLADQASTPTLAADLAEMLWTLGRDSGATGLFHVAGADTVTRYDFARLVAERFGFDPELVEPTDSSRLDQAARRPLKAGLRTDRLRSRYPALTIPTLRAAVSALYHERGGHVR